MHCFTYWSIVKKPHPLKDWQEAVQSGGHSYCWVSAATKIFFLFFSYRQRSCHDDAGLTCPWCFTNKCLWYHLPSKAVSICIIFEGITCKITFISVSYVECNHKENKKENTLVTEREQKLYKRNHELQAKVKLCSAWELSDAPRQRRESHTIEKNVPTINKQVNRFLFILFFYFICYLVEMYWTETSKASVILCPAVTDHRFISNRAHSLRARVTGAANNFHWHSKIQASIFNKEDLDL